MVYEHVRRFFNKRMVGNPWTAVEDQMTCVVVKKGE